MVRGRSYTCVTTLTLPRNPVNKRTQDGRMRSRPPRVVTLSGVYLARR
jgi:hypothetical protein